MKKRAYGPAFRHAVAIVGLAAGVAALSGCTTLGSRTFGDPTVTGSSGVSSAGNLNQPMPGTLVATAPNQGRYLPPANVGAGSGVSTFGPAPVGQVSSPSSVVSQPLPDLAPTPSIGSTPSMPAQQPVMQASVPNTLGSLPPAPPPAAPAQARLTAVPDNAYTHTIGAGESLYTIARRYNVTTDSIVQANGLGAPDKIFVGQKVVIPGRADLAGTPAPAPAQTAPAQASAPAPAAATQAQSTPAPAPSQPAPVQASAPAPAQAQPVATDKFRWPVSGRVITTFAASRGTGINIEVPEGTAVRAAEAGQVIYVGDAVEGYGNLVLVRHSNGYVSAYAHLGSIGVRKDDTVARGDTLGTAGMTGSVSKPQLHFELRQGATPVDPVPLLAS